MKYVIGVDAGTTCLKAGIYDCSLKTIARNSIEYQLLYSKNGFIENPPEKYWELFCQLVKTLIKDSEISPSDIVGLSICSQGETMICLDENGNPLRNAIVWTDARATEQCEYLSRKFSNKEVFEITGQREITATWPASKLLWIKDNEPGIFEKTAHILMLEDYFIYRLTGCFATDKSISSSTVYLDIYQGKWWNEMIDYIGISVDKLPVLYESGEVIAPVSDMGGFESGLSPRTMIISGAMDQASGMLGAGNIQTGIITETTGTCLAVCANIGSKRLAFETGLLPTHHGIMPDSYYTIYWSAAAGSIYRWIRDVFYKSDSSYESFSLIDSESSDIDIGCDGLLLMPFLSGINYPFVNESAKGRFLGISLIHTRGHFARAVLESIAFLLRQSIDEIAQYGIKVDKIYSLGGGASSPTWNQIKADITNKNIITLQEQEATCQGAAIMAAVGMKLFDSYTSAIANCVSESNNYYPEKPAEYQLVYENFLKEFERYS